MTAIKTRTFSSFLPNGRTRLLGILGDPITHSLSPELHSAVLRRLDRNMLYVPVPVSSARLFRFLELADELGFVGCNVTTPFKERVLRRSEAQEVETRRTAMANTLTFRPGRPPLAQGTDGRGILGWLDDLGLGEAPFAVLGFGASARSLVHAAWNRGMPPAVVLTRRPGPVRRSLSSWAEERGRGRLRGRAPEVCGLGAIGVPRTDGRSASAASGRGPTAGVESWRDIRVWISTWPPGALPPKSFWRSISRRSLILDLNYGEGRTTLASASRSEGYGAADGLGPLLHQAARSLSVWLDEPVEPKLFRQAAGASVRRIGFVR